MVFKSNLNLKSIIFSKALNRTWHYELFVHMLNDCHLLLLLGFKKSVYFKWELWRTAQHSCKLFQISFYKFKLQIVCTVLFDHKSALFHMSDVCNTSPKNEQT